MELRKFREDGRILVGPKHKKDTFMFSHCANGSIAVITKVYNSEVEPMLWAHGAHFVNISDET